MAFLMLALPNFCPTSVSSAFHFSMLLTNNIIMHFFNQLWRYHVIGPLVVCPYHFEPSQPSLKNSFINQQLVLCSPQFSLAPLLFLWSQFLTLQMVILIVTKYSSDYFPHKRQACCWPKVDDIIPFFPIFHSKYCSTCGKPVWSLIHPWV